ncbi:MAG: VanW family protein [Eubacteriales bacterium]
MSNTINKKVIIALFILLIFLVIGFFVSGFFAIKQNRDLSANQIDNIVEKNILDEGVYIGGINVSGMDEAEARKAIEPRLDTWYIDKDIAFTVDDSAFLYNVADFGVTPDIDKAIQDAFLYSSKDILPEDYTPETTDDGGLNFPLQPDVSLDAILSFLLSEDVQSTINISPDDAGVIFRPSVEDEEKRFSYEQPIPGQEVKVDEFSSLVYDAILANDYSVLEAPYNEINSFTSIDDMKYKTQLIGTYTSQIKSRGEARVSNIKRLVELINQRVSVIQPGDTISLNGDCGARTLETGFSEAPALNAGAHVYEVGGGVCQVSSTLYIAALTAELDIPARTHHSLVSEYIPAGLDSTISFTPDLKITNNKTSPIYISMVVDEKNYTVTCNIYGAPPAHGYTVEMLSKIYKTTIPSPASYSYAETSPGGVSIAPGRTYAYTEPAYGTRVKVYRLYKDPEGNVVKSEFLYSDIYDAIPGDYYINPNAK